MASVAERVRAGATFLDGHVVGWAEKINIGSLDMEECASCIIGQAVGLYTDALESLGLNEVKEVGYGFESALVIANENKWAKFTPNEYHALVEQVAAEYAALKAAWLVEIAERVDTPESKAAAVEAEEALVLASAPDLSLEGSPL